MFYTGSVYDRAYPLVACLYSLFVYYSILCGTVMTWNLSIILFYFREYYLTDDTYGRDIWIPYLFIVL